MESIENKLSQQEEIINSKIFRFLDIIFEMHRLIHGWVQPLLKAKGLSVSELGVFLLLSTQGSYRLTDLSRELGLPASTLTGIIDRLILREYVSRVRSEDDRRSVEISPTPKLLETSKIINKAIRESLAEALTDIPDPILVHVNEDLNAILLHLKSIERKSQ